MNQSNSVPEIFDVLTLVYGIFGLLTLIILPGTISRDDYHPGLIKTWVICGAILCLLVTCRGEYLFPALVTTIISGIFLAQKRK